MNQTSNRSKETESWIGRGLIKSYNKSFSQNEDEKTKRRQD